MLWVTLLFAAMLGINRLFVADHEEGGFDGFLLAPVDRTALFVAKALALLALPRRCSSSSPCPRSRCCCSGPAPWPARSRGCSSCSCSPTSGIAVVGTLVGALAVQTRARDLHRAAARPCRCSIPVVIGAAQATAPLLAGGRRRGAPRRAGWRSSASMIWSSGSSPTRSSTSCSRTEPPVLYGNAPPHASPSLTAVTLTAAFALAFFYAPDDADQGFMQKIFYLHVPMAIVALCGFVSGGILAIQHLRTRRPRARTCAPTWRSTCP